MQQILRRKLSKGRFPRQSKISIVLIIMIIIAFFIWSPVKEIFNLNSTNESMLVNDTMIAIDESSLGSNAAESEALTSDTEEGDINEYSVESGDTIAKILVEHHISTKDIFTLTNKYPKIAKELRPEQTLSWVLTAEGGLQSLTWIVNRKETRTYELTAEGFIEHIEYTQGEWREAIVTGKIEIGQSFCGAATGYGISNAECQNASRYLRNIVNLKTLQPGDRFSLYIEREFVNDDVTGSRLLAARINTRKNDNYIFYFDKYKAYYDSEGRTFAEGFLRIPVLTSKDYRISSHFNPARLNPVTRRVTPHNGVDFAMPVGTALVAAGDGEVLTAKFSSSAGNYVAIKHGKQYMTRYMHMSKLAVRAGQIVKRGDIIGYSGNTGRSSGPHLHYEFWIDNKPVNPIKVTLPRPQGLTKADLVDFKQQNSAIKAKMDEALRLALEEETVRQSTLTEPTQTAMLSEQSAIETLSDHGTQRDSMDQLIQDITQATKDATQ